MNRQKRMANGIFGNRYSKRLAVIAGGAKVNAAASIRQNIAIFFIRSSE